MEAHDTIKRLKDNFESETKEIFTAYDNDILHDLLNDSAVYVTDIREQEVWVFGDGSYITRNIDEYWTGNNFDILTDN